MSGTLVIKPLEAELTHDTDWITKMDPYVQVVLGTQKAKGQVNHGGGKNPKWSDTISIQRTYEPAAYIEIKDKDTFSSDDLVGCAQVDLNQLPPGSVVAEWYPLFFNQKPAGKVLLEIVFSPDQNSQQAPEGHHHHQHAYHSQHFL